MVVKKRSDCGTISCYDTYAAILFCVIPNIIMTNGINVSGCNWHPSMRLNLLGNLKHQSRYRQAGSLRLVLQGGLLIKMPICLCPFTPVIGKHMGLSLLPALTIYQLAIFVKVNPVDLHLSVACRIDHIQPELLDITGPLGVVGDPDGIGAKLGVVGHD